MAGGKRGSPLTPASADVIIGQTIKTRNPFQMGKGLDCFMNWMAAVLALFASSAGCMRPLLSVRAASKTNNRQDRLSRLPLLHVEMPPPDLIDGRVDDEFHDKGSENAADHGGGDAFHDVRAGPRGPHDRDEAHEHDVGRRRDRRGIRNRVLH
jgi:hypothetical protein